MKFKNTIIYISLILVLFIFTTKVNALTYTTQDLDYRESTETLKNPERGFYEPLGLMLKESNNHPNNYSSNLVHLRVGLKAFSGKFNGKGDIPLTQDALNSLDKTIKNVRAGGGSVIIRFAYDNFDGVANPEPSLDMVLKHLDQLKVIFDNNKDTIIYVELGLFGKWGEMHSSSLINTNNVNLILNKMLSIVPEDITVGVRQPGYFANFVGVNRASLASYISKKGDLSYRVGLYNDGYLGSESDLGTFANRSIETSWLKRQATHTFYGGEVVANFASGTPLNTVSYIEREGFITHTTYLNLRWNYTVIDSWKKSTYNGSDEVYKGLSGFTYINNHLGYRLVLRKSDIKTNTYQLDNIEGKILVENVGFANLINKKITTIVITNGTNTYEYKINFDARTILSKSAKEIPFNIKLNNKIPSGKYKLYLRISEYGNIDNNYKSIRFANNNIYNETLSGNYIGEINVLDSFKPTPTTTTKKTTKPLITTTRLTSGQTTISSEMVTTKPMIKTTDKISEKATTSTISISTETTTNNSAEEILYIENDDKEENKKIINKENKKNYTISIGFIILFIVIILYYIVRRSTYERDRIKH